MTKWHKYPKLQHLGHFTNGEIRDCFVGVPVYQERKYDGSNISVLMSDDFVAVYSRNQLANTDIQEAVKNYLKTCDYEMIKRYLSDGFTFYLELRKKGKSPTGLNTYDETSCIGLDVRDSDGAFLCNDEKREIFRQCDISNAELIDTHVFRSVESLKKHALAWRERIIDTDDWEGCVYKTENIDHYGNPLWFKDRRDYGIPEETDSWVKQHKSKKKNKGRKPAPQKVLPPLDDAECMGVVNKVANELESDEFRDKSVAMPLIARRMHEEAQSHDCAMPRNIFRYYQRYLMEH